MKQQSVTAAETELRRAIQKCEMLKDARSFDEIATYWAEFLVAANRVYSKLEQGAKDGSSKGWFDSKKNLRRVDPLLTYIQHARNADEHGIEEVARRYPPSLALDTDEGRLELPLTPGSHQVSFYGSPPKLIWMPPTIRVVPIADRGKTYLPPSSHLGQPVKGTGLLDIIGLAIQYLKSLVSEAKERVVHSRPE